MIDPRPTTPLAPGVIRRPYTVAAAEDALFGGWGVRTLFCAQR